MEFGCCPSSEPRASNRSRGPRRFPMMLLRVLKALFGASCCTWSSLVVRLPYVLGLYAMCSHARACAGCILWKDADLHPADLHLENQSSYIKL